MFEVATPADGRLFMSPAPRPLEAWLSEAAALAKTCHCADRDGAVLVCSLLEAQEAASLGLAGEALRIDEHRELTMTQLAIQDRGVPAVSRLQDLVLKLEAHLVRRAGTVIVHCHGGIGRSGLVAACLLRTFGADTAVAIASVSKARGVMSPETAAQRALIETFVALPVPHFSNAGPPAWVRPRGYARMRP